MRGCVCRWLGKEKLRDDGADVGVSYNDGRWVDVDLDERLVCHSQFSGETAGDKVGRIGLVLSKGLNGGQ